MYEIHHMVYQMMMQMQKQQKAMQQEAERKSAVQRAMGVKETVTPEGTIRERNIPAPGQESQFYGSRLMGAAGELGDIDMRLYKMEIKQ